MATNFTMKSLLVIFLSIMSITACGQQYLKGVKNVTDKSIIKFLNNIDTSFIKRSDKLLIKFFLVSNGSGSANVPQGDEISHNIIISVAEYDENPLNRVFNIGPFYMPELSNGSNLKDGYSILIEHGASDERKRSKLFIYLNKVYVKDP